MAYIDYEYYSESYCGVDIPEGEFAALAERASDFVDLKTFHRINDLSALEGAVQEKVKKATAIYTEQFFMQGGVDAYTGFSAAIAQNTITIGKTSISGGSGEGERHGLTTTGGIVDNPIADSLLRSTGLCYRGVY